MSRTRVRTILALVACGGALAFLTTPTANASPMSYLNALKAAGITVNDPAAAVSAGYRICGDLNTHTGDVTVYRIYNTYSDVTSLDQAARMLVASVEQLCPWQDHRNSAVAA